MVQLYQARFPGANDGILDLAVGAPSDDDGGASGSVRGAVWILFLNEIETNFPVGGTSLPIDTTSLLLAGASVNVWMIPVVLSAAGFGILIARKI